MRKILHVHISTESVYVLCELEGVTLVTEGHAVRPGSGAERAALKEKEPYGHKKLQCKDALKGNKLYNLTRLDDTCRLGALARVSCGC